MDLPKMKRRKKKKRPPHKSKMITGYIIYASEIRKEVIKKYPDRDFGDISKLVGIEWKNLPKETKIAYEKRAQEQNAKSKAVAAEALELKKLADAAEEKAKEEEAKIQSANSQQLPTTTCNGLMIASNGHSQPIMMMNHVIVEGQDLSHSPDSSMLSSQLIDDRMQLCHNQSTPIQSQHTMPNIVMRSSMQQQQQPPLQIIKQQQQPIGTTVQYCNSHNNTTNNGNPMPSTYNPSPQSPSLQSQQQQQQPQQHQQQPSVQYQRNNIVYRKPATVRLRPKESSTQTDPIKWVDPNVPERRPLKFSQKFIEHLSSNRVIYEKIIQ